MKKVELLAPAGNYEALTGAFAAGADAVYLGGSDFGARAYAENFTKEEICRGIRTAHLLNKKIYLTVNTLVKEQEFEKLYSFLLPFYEEGLDGVIVQDMGVFRFIRSHFPLLALHASTQMTITSSHGARLLAAEGAKRIVPARELSLPEIKKIKQQVDIEIETFIHGAMCYSYSGQCLFSSILGGRSGNRGRCAQPCRLPYRIDHGKECYPLSMKDMCTLNILPELIEAGIDSFKIEGRMKKPEYAAGVTAVYRKYIDRYLQEPETYQMENEDFNFLSSLYIRTEIGEGYYHRQNGREMLTLDSPAYLGSDERVLFEIRKTYIEPGLGIDTQAKVRLKPGQEAVMMVRTGDSCAVYQGDLVQSAQKQPLLPEKIKGQLSKKGDTLFEITSLQMDLGEKIFMPISSLNQLRRGAFSKLEEQILTDRGFTVSGRIAAAPEKTGQSFSVKHAEKREKKTLHALVTEREQLLEAALAGLSRIYLDRIRPDDGLTGELRSLRERGCEFYLAFPYIVRDRDERRMEELYGLLEEDVFSGALVRNLETLSFLEERGFKKPVVTDGNLYVWNQSACDFFAERVSEIYLPAELNRQEIRELVQKTEGRGCLLSAMVYGRLPMMVSAGCVRKTAKGCDRAFGYSTLTDRYGKEFPVCTDCDFCYNIIYNSLPLSLHKLFLREKTVPDVSRLDFTIESGAKAGAVIRYFQGLLKHYEEPFYKDFTAGHYNRGVE